MCNLEEKYMRIAVFGAVTLLLVLAIFVSVSTISLSFDQTNVTAKVNITQSQPEILAISVNNGSAVNLAEGTTKLVICNITIRDYNGHVDINTVNATLYDYAQSTAFATDDNNDHYTNSSCVDKTIIDANTAVWSCNYDVYYYANNGTWSCYATVNDTYGFSDNGTGNGSINALYAINVTNEINYGDMAVGDTSTTSQIANVTNFGNQNINVSVYGWGGTNLSDPIGNGYAFLCQVGNITVPNQRYSINDVVWSSMNPLSSTSTHIPGLTVPQQTNDSQAVINQTYWRLYVPPNPFGECNGTVVFEAELP